MPRTARSIVRNHCYHLINRGNGQARIFHNRLDYSAFVELIAEAQERLPLPLLAACLMPNHIHLVVQPKADDDLARWTHWLFTTHVRRHHNKYGTNGRLWQGRFKAFVIQQDDHLLSVLRYVERNALRANLVQRAERWRWGSLHWRIASQSPLMLADWPLRTPHNWVEYVNRPQSPQELEAIRTCVNRQRPFGSRAWVEQKARDLGLSHALNRPGRPCRK